MKLVLLFILLAVVIVTVMGVYHSKKSLPPGLDFRGEEKPVPADSVRFLADVTASGGDEGAWIHQEIFEEVFEMMDRADQFIVADFFLINEFAGEAPEVGDGPTLSESFIESLIRARHRVPGMPIILITDPLNELYGGVDQPLFDRLTEVGVEVVFTDLRKLHDSNLVFSPIWRAFFQWWGSPRGDLFANPIGDGRIGLSAMLEMLNFKANHRKVLITGRGEDGLQGLVTSANPHSASALHGNVALRFSGPLAVDLLESERAVYQMSTGRDFPIEIERSLAAFSSATPAQPGGLVGRVLTERSIKRELLERIRSLAEGDRVDLALFYFSDMDLRYELADAVSRGATIRLLMDPNKDGFGRKKNGIPNRQVGFWLSERGVDVRWYRTSGEQFHSKMAHFHFGTGEDCLILGSANWTRRNLNNLNLETVISISGPSAFPVFGEAEDYFSWVWGDAVDGGYKGAPEGLITSVPFEEFRDSSTMRRILYWLMEKTGASTF